MHTMDRNLSTLQKLHDIKIRKRVPLMLDASKKADITEDLLKRDEVDKIKSTIYQEGRRSIQQMYLKVKTQQNPLLYDPLNK